MRGSLPSVIFDFLLHQKLRAFVVKVLEHYEWKLASRLLMVGLLACSNHRLPFVAAL